MEKPNLFSIATKELSQDAFITWLLQWADDKYKKENEHLCLLGKEFAKSLIKLDKKLNAENIKIAKVTAGRQWENIDIWAEINDDYALIIEDWNEWNYVANTSGGFLGFWYYFTACKKTKGAEIYIQLENRFDSGIDLCIKIGADWERTTEHLYKIYGILFEEAKKFNIEITKPKRFKAGAYSTVALVKNAFTTNIDGKLDLDNFLKVLTNTEELVAETALKC